MTQEDAESTQEIICIELETLFSYAHRVERFNDGTMRLIFGRFDRKRKIPKQNVTGSNPVTCSSEKHAIFRRVLFYCGYLIYDLPSASSLQCVQ